MKRRNFIKTTSYTGIAFGFVSTPGLSALTTNWGAPGCNDDIAIDQRVVHHTATFKQSYTRWDGFRPSGKALPTVYRASGGRSDFNIAPIAPKAGFFRTLDSSDPNCPLKLASVSDWATSNVNFTGQPGTVTNLSEEQLRALGYGEFNTVEYTITATWDSTVTAVYVCSSNSGSTVSGAVGAPGNTACDVPPGP